MQADIYYFSGTGNSLFVAKSLAGRLGTGIVTRITRQSLGTAPKTAADVVGFVFPVYFHTAPEIVRQFIRNLHVEGRPYIFSAATSNAEPGSANFDVDRLLRAKGRRLDAGFALTMPGNSVILIDYTTPEPERERRLAESEGRIAHIAETILKRERAPLEGDRGLGQGLKSLATRIASGIYRVPRRLWVDARCSRCGTCVRVCPEGNVSLDDRVTFGNDCSNCLACYHWCPRQAIHLGKKGIEKRYHHPRIAPSDMLAR
jgi:ferredoxin/flavodoxin